MNESDALLIAQLLRTMRELTEVLNKALLTKNYVKLMETKKEMLAIQTRLRELL
jgi:hypothetical protein